MSQINRISGKDIHVLLVEDNYSDVVLIKEALAEGHISTLLDTVKDGAEALEFLNKKGVYANSKSPDLILLDLNLPKLDGIEVLKSIKNNENLKEIPVIVLTTSSDRQDIKNAYRNYANSYIVKPIDFDKFLEVIKTLEQFWLNITELPAQ